MHNDAQREKADNIPCISHILPRIAGGVSHVRFWPSRICKADSTILTNGNSFGCFLVREVRYIFNLLQDTMTGIAPVPACSNNQGAGHLASDYANNGRSEQTEARNMYVCEMVRSDIVGPLYVSTDQNTAAIFTKPLPAPSFVTQRRGVV
ncbi:hypothetical protein CYMTET_51997 [Cymbomonas tetramitiformis]|uniref:Uncharacterized protein n=1 Tax=Cymbomonas tetramitiformis TaxID=36881 RepID=A0AAE0ET53_9CHLO|nr:hypothetical protein CYMTET_51997 [Cymbomonas tetramitiformis]|eukprot:gene18148-biopygen18723